LEIIAHFCAQVVHNGFTWKNLVGVLASLWVLRQLYKAITTGVLDTMWNTHPDVQKSRILFAADFVVMLIVLGCMLTFALGFINFL